MVKQIYKKEHFDTFLVTLKEASKDDDGNYVVEDINVVYDFDKISETIATDYRFKYTCCSADALYINKNDEIYLIEFKNARQNRIRPKQLHKKAYDSIYTLQTMLYPDKSINELSSKTTLIVVYNNSVILSEEYQENDSHYFNIFKQKVRSFANLSKDYPQWNLDKYVGKFYKNVYTLEKNDFLGIIDSIFT